MKIRQVQTLSVFILLVLAYFSVGWESPDEHFQILEFAALKMQMTTPDQLPWEFHFQIRSAFQPALVVIIHQFFSLFGCTDPFLISFFLRVLTVVLTFTSMVMIYRCYAPEIKPMQLQKWFLLLSFLLWFALLNNVRFRSETWSGSLFIIGFCYLFRLTRDPQGRDFLITGMLLGLAFVVRYQTGLLIAGFVFWLLLIKREKLANLAFLFLGTGISVLSGVLLDRWFYGEWTFTAWHYFNQNIIQDKVSGFGIDPWWFYFQDVFIRAIPPFSLIFILSFLVVVIFLRKDVLTWILVPYVVVHCLIGHKETRFLYPLIGFLPILAIKAYEFIIHRWKINPAENRWFRGYTRLFWYFNIILIAVVMFIPAEPQTRLYQCIYENYPQPATLYYLSENPYYRAKEVHYYKRASLVIKDAKDRSGDQLSSGKKYLLALSKKDARQPSNKNQKLIYSTYPEWIKRFNFNNWLDRTQIWYIYEIN
jgi:phosphatidylinositol glycan class B